MTIFHIHIYEGKMSNRTKAAKAAAPKPAASSKKPAKKPAKKKLDNLAALEELSGAYDFLSATDAAAETAAPDAVAAVEEAMSELPLLDADASRNLDSTEPTATLPGLDGNDRMDEQDIAYLASADESGLDAEYTGDSHEDIIIDDGDILEGVVVDDEHNQSVQELLSYIAVREPGTGSLVIDTDCSVIGREILAALDIDEIKALTALYKLTYEGMAKTAADNYADELIARITNSAAHCAVVDIIDQRQRLLVKMAQNVQRVFNTDVVYDKLTADDFSNRAIEAIKDNSVLRSAICELGRAMNHPDVPNEADIASLKALIRIISHAAAHLHSVPGFRNTTQAAVTRLSSELAAKDRTIAKLEAALAAKQSEDAIAVEVAMQTARVFPKETDIPRSIMVSNGNNKFLCFLDHRGVPTRRPLQDPSLVHIGWTTNMARAIGFTTKTEAVTAVERILLLEAAGPFSDNGKGMKLRGQDVRNLRYARIAAIFSERV